MAARILVPVVAGMLLTASLLAQNADQKELDKLQGDWVAAALEVRGQKLPEETVKQYKLTIKGNQWTVSSNMKEDKITFKLDPSKDPKAIDLTYVGPLGKESNWLGIYKLEGDTLTMIRVPGILERPKEFKTTPQVGQMSVWKRAGK
jgi:uncharacterized protein (TIGR03067 family)